MEQNGQVLTRATCMPDVIDDVDVGFSFSQNREF